MRTILTYTNLYELYFHKGIVSDLSFYNDLEPSAL